MDIVLRTLDGGKTTRGKGICRSGRLPHIVIHFWMDKADHDNRLISDSAETLFACPDIENKAIVYCRTSYLK